MGKLNDIPKEKTDRLLIYGFHPGDVRNPKPVFCFWASKHLMEEYPCVGDLVNVKTRMRKKNGELGYRFTPLYVTDLKKWEPGDFEPSAIARRLYRGDKYRDCVFDVDALN